MENNLNPGTPYNPTMDLNANLFIGESLNLPDCDGEALDASLLANASLLLEDVDRLDEILCLV